MRPAARVAVIAMASLGWGLAHAPLFGATKLPLAGLYGYTLIAYAFQFGLGTWAARSGGSCSANPERRGRLITLGFAALAAGIVIASRTESYALRALALAVGGALFKCERVLRLVGGLVELFGRLFDARGHALGTGRHERAAQRNAAFERHDRRTRVQASLADKLR